MIEEHNIANIFTQKYKNGALYTPVSLVIIIDSIKLTSHHVTFPQADGAEQQKCAPMQKGGFFGIRKTWTKIHESLNSFNIHNMQQKPCIALPPVRIELTTPGLQDQCSAPELRRRVFPLANM